MVPVYHPTSETELALLSSWLEANDIPCFVHNRGFGSLYPGVQVELYNARTVCVPEAFVAEAAEAIKEFLAGFERRPMERTGKIRIALEALFFGWFVPDR